MQSSIDFLTMNEKGNCSSQIFFLL